MREMISLGVSREATREWARASISSRDPKPLLVFASLSFFNRDEVSMMDVVLRYGDCEKC